jgi:hypothetical protein
MNKAIEILEKHLQPNKITDGFRLLLWNINKPKILKAMEEYKNITEENRKG